MIDFNLHNKLSKYNTTSSSDDIDNVIKWHEQQKLALQFFLAHNGYTRVHIIQGA